MLALLAALALAAEANPLQSCEVRRHGLSGRSYQCGPDTLTFAESTRGSDADLIKDELAALMAQGSGTLSSEPRKLELPGWSGPGTHLRLVDPAQPGKVLAEGDLAVARQDANHARTVSCLARPAEPGAKAEPSRCAERLAYLLTFGPPAVPHLAELPLGPHFMGRRLALPEGCRASNITPGTTTVECADGSALQWGAAPAGHEDAATAQFARQLEYLHKNAHKLTEEKVSCVIEGAASTCQRLHADGAEVVLATPKVAGQVLNFMCAYTDGQPVPPVCSSMLTLGEAAK